MLGVILVESVELRWFHLLKVILSEFLAHQPECRISSLRLLVQVRADLLLVTQVGVARLLYSQLAHAGDASRRCDLLVSHHDSIVEQCVSLAALRVFNGKDPLERCLVSVSVGRHCPVSMGFSLSRALYDALCSVQNV